MRTHDPIRFDSDGITETNRSKYLIQIKLNWMMCFSDFDFNGRFVMCAFSHGE